MIHLRGITQTYQGSQGPVEALRGIDLQITPGEVFGIIGRSGAGKSSLVRVINLLNRPTRGAVVVAGRDLTQLNGEQLRAARRDIGMVFQHFNLLSSRTVYDNVALPLIIDGFTPAEAQKRVSAALDKVGLHDKSGYLPLMLSGGEQQRVGIARAIVNTPPLLLADEPTGNLDAQLAADIMQLFAEFNDVGVTVLIASHDQGLIRASGCRTLTLHEGRLMGDQVSGDRNEA